MELFGVRRPPRRFGATVREQQFCTKSNCFILLQQLRYRFGAMKSRVVHWCLPVQILSVYICTMLN